MTEMRQSDCKYHGGATGKPIYTVNTGRPSISRKFKLQGREKRHSLHRTV